MSNHFDFDSYLWFNMRRWPSLMLESGMWVLDEGHGLTKYEHFRFKSLHTHTSPYIYIYICWIWKTTSPHLANLDLIHVKELICGSVYSSLSSWHANDETLNPYVSARSTLLGRNGTHLGIASQLFSALPWSHLYLDPPSRNPRLRKWWQSLIWCDTLLHNSRSSKEEGEIYGACHSIPRFYGYLCSRDLCMRNSKIFDGSTLYLVCEIKPCLKHDWEHIASLLITKFFYAEAKFILAKLERTC